MGNERRLVIIANPYPWVNQRGGASADCVVELLSELKGMGVDDVHWEVIRNHTLYPSEAGEILPSSEQWPGDKPISDFAHTVNPFEMDVVPLVCMNRHYHGEVREFLQTSWAKTRWGLLASTPNGDRLGNGHVMDHLWSEVENHSTALLNEVVSLSQNGVHLDFTRGVALVGFGNPLRAAWTAFESGISDLDDLISIANGADVEEGPPFSAWEELPSGIHELRCQLTLHLLHRMLDNAGCSSDGVHIRMLLREKEWMRVEYGIDVDLWIQSGIASEFSFHNEWVDGEDCEWWSLSPLSDYVTACHENNLLCFASVDWYGTGLTSQRPVIDEAHQVPLPSPATTRPPNTEQLLTWVDGVLTRDVDGLMIYDGHLGQLGGGIEVCKQLRSRLD